mgnify:CR=1 FL=1
MVNVDRVYQKVLVLANKEQRGYITPQEFNLLADQAQIDIFEQYFYDLNQFRRLPGNDSKYADMIDMLEEKINFFKMGPIGMESSGTLIDTISGTTNFDVYKITDINYNGRVLEEIRYEDYFKLQTPLTRASSTRPHFWRKDGRLWWEPVEGDISIHWIRRPLRVNWTFITAGGIAVYNDAANDHQHFELHPSEEADLVIKILTLAGITIKDQGLYGIGAKEDISNIQQEKQ